MKLIRSNIIRLCTVAFLCFGFGLYIAQPVQAKSSAHSFASWFSSVAKEADTNELVQELHRLKNTGVELSDLIEHASLIISKHNKAFNLPLEGASASQQIYQVLLTQWNQFQTGNGMAKVPPPETVKTGLNMQVDKSGTLGLGSSAEIPAVHRWDPAGSDHTESRSFDRSLTPMAAGIAIGAP